MPRSHALFVTALAALGWLCADIAPGDPGWPGGYPAWWYNASDPANGVIDATRPVLNQGNDAPLVLGQLKHFASEARDELDAKLPNGAGPDIDTLVNGFTTVTLDNLAPANLGQLKAVAAPFYTRFAQEGFTPGSPGWPVGMELIDTSGVTDNSPNYPWLDDVTPGNAHIAMIGQAKFLFSWDLSTWTPSSLDPNDTDGDGLLDAWEQQIIDAAQNDADPTNDFIDGLDDVLPEEPADSTGLDSRLWDFDGDGKDHQSEYQAGSDPTDPTNETVDDPDGDGLGSDYEALLGTDPLQPDHPDVQLMLLAPSGL